MRLFLLLLLLPLLTVGQDLETVIQKGHELAVIAVAVSPDSNYVATGSRDYSARLWELSTGREVRSFLGHDRGVNGLSFSANGQTLLTSSGDKTIRLWDVQSGRLQWTLNPDNEVMTSVTFGAGSTYFITAGYSDTARVFDLKTRKQIASMPVNPDKSQGYGVSIAVSKDGHWVAFGEDNRVATVYRTADWKKAYTYEFKEGWCGGCETAVTFSADSRYLFMASHNGSVKKYDLADGRLVATLMEHVENLSALAASSTAPRLSVVTKDSIWLFDVQHDKLLRKYASGQPQEINDAVFTADGKHLLLASNDNTAIRWNLASGKVTSRLTGYLHDRDAGGIQYDINSYWENQIARYVRFRNSLLVTPDGKYLIKGKFGNKAKRWDIAGGRTVMEYSGHKKAVLCQDLSRDGKRLVTGGGDGKIILWDTETGDSIKVIRAHREPILDIHFSSDEQRILASSWDATMVSWDLTTGKSQAYFDFQNSSAYSTLWGPEDLYFIAAQGQVLKMWEPDSRTAVREFVGHQDVIGSLRLNKSRSQLLSASWDGSIRLWDVGTGLMKRKFSGHLGAVHVAIFNPEETAVYSAGTDRLIRLWDISSGRVLKTFEGHKAEVTSLVLSPDGKMLISHSVDGATKFWDLGTGREFFEHIHFGSGEWMAKNPDGYFNGTEAARRYVHFVRGVKTYGIDQFFEEFFRPDLLPQIFRERGSTEEKSLQGRLLKSPPPTVKVALMPPAESGQAELLVRMTDQGAGVSELKVFQNGKSLALEARQVQYPSGVGNTTTARITVGLVGGTNVFTATARNRDKLESDPASVEFTLESTTVTSTCHVLAVGINQYRNPRLSLNYAQPDAAAFADALNAGGAKLFRKVSVHNIFDTQASRANILAKLDELAAVVQPQDVFVLYYAGHGSMTEGNFYFIPSESLRLYDVSALKKDAIEASELQSRLTHIKALKQLIIMDACQSGGSVELLASRGAEEEKAIAQLSRSAGIHVMASAGSEQFAAEFSELGHGLFTYLLIRGLQGAADGAPKDGKVTIYELKSYLDDQVPELTRKLKGKPQYPYTFSRGHDFPVVLDHH